MSGSVLPPLEFVPVLGAGPGKSQSPQAYGPWEKGTQMDINTTCGVVWDRYYKNICQSTVTLLLVCCALALVANPSVAATPAPQDSKPVSPSPPPSAGRALIYVYFDPHGKKWEITGKRVSIDGIVVLDENSAFHVGYARYETDPGMVTLSVEQWDNGVRHIPTHQTCFVGRAPECRDDGWRAVQEVPSWVPWATPDGLAIRCQVGVADCNRPPSRLRKNGLRDLDSLQS